MAETERRTEQQPFAPDLKSVVQEFAAPLYRYAYRLTGCPADAEDLVQQTFLVAQTRLEQLRDPARLSSWLYAVLRHTWCKSKRREQLHRHALEQLELPSANPPEDEAVDREQLQAALNDLPAEFRVILLMFYFEELSYQEIAAQLEIPMGTVMSRLSRAKGHLRRRLEPQDKPAVVRPALPPPSNTLAAPFAPAYR